MYFTSIMKKRGRPTKTDAPDFGNRLAKLRKQNNLTQIELGEKVELTQKAIDYYERRASKPSIELLFKLSQVFGVTTDELLGLSPNSQSNSKPGPISQLEQRFEQLKQLPKTQQKTVIAMLDGLLEKSGNF